MYLKTIDKLGKFYISVFPSKISFNGLLEGKSINDGDVNDRQNHPGKTN